MKVTFRIFVLLLFGFILHHTQLHAQQFQTDELNRYFDTLENNQKFMGSVAVAMNGKLVYYRGTGLCNAETQTKPDITSSYKIGSISKTFTATLIMKAVELGKLDLDQNLSEFFTDFPRGDEITIHQMLHHRSGIHNFTSDSLYLTYHTQKKSRGEMISIITQKPLGFEPNAQFDYSNSNYVLLSYILEDIFDMSYAEILDFYIVQPLELKHTSINESTQADKNVCNSYKSFKAGNYQKSEETHASIPLGAGGIRSSAEDLLKFSDALFSGKIVSKNSLTSMQDFYGNYGKGLIRVPFYDKTGYGHTGGINSFRSALFYFPAKNISYVLLSNGIEIVPNNINIAVLSAAYNKPIEMPTFTQYKMDRERLAAFVGHYSSKEIPLEIEIFLDDGILYGQGTGQDSFSLKPQDALILGSEQFNVKLIFDEDLNGFKLKQNGASFQYHRMED